MKEFQRKNEDEKERPARGHALLTTFKQYRQKVNLFSIVINEQSRWYFLILSDESMRQLNEIDS